jgi:hypothetical protein
MPRFQNVFRENARFHEVDEGWGDRGRSEMPPRSAATTRAWVLDGARRPRCLLGPCGIRIRCFRIRRIAWENCANLRLKCLSRCWSKKPMGAKFAYWQGVSIHGPDTHDPGSVARGHGLRNDEEAESRGPRSSAHTLEGGSTNCSRLMSSMGDRREGRCKGQLNLSKTPKFLRVPASQESQERCCAEFKRATMARGMSAESLVW